MADNEWKEVTEEINDNVWDREGTVQGVYTQKKTNVGPNDSTMYVLKNKDGNVSVWGSAVLDARFEQIPLGAEVRIESLGKETSEKTGRSYYNYKVEFRAVPFEEVGDKSEPKASDKPSKDEPEDVNLADIPF